MADSEPLRRPVRKLRGSGISWVRSIMCPWVIRLARFGTVPTYLFCFTTSHPPNYCFLNTRRCKLAEGCSEDLLLIYPRNAFHFGFSYSEKPAGDRCRR